MMLDVVVIKTSSLGDVVHNLPVVADIRAHVADVKLTWVVEEAYAPLVRLHGGVDEIVEVATRRWRRAPLSPATFRDMRDVARRLRARRHDIVIDTQGLARSAIIARLTPGVRHGFDRASMREPFAGPLYDIRHAVARGLHAIDRNRLLAAKALGYEVSGAPDYGLTRPAPVPGQTPYAVLLHGSAQPAKEWPDGAWVLVGTALERSGYDLVLPWGDERERERSERLARMLRRGRVPDRRPLDGVATLLGNAALVVGLDTGLLHLAAALTVPLVGVFVNSDPALTGPRGQGPMEVLGRRGAAPDAESVIAAAARIAPPRA